MCTGPTVRDAFADGGDVLAQLLRDHGYRHTDYYRAARSAAVPPRGAGRRSARPDGSRRSHPDRGLARPACRVRCSSIASSRGSSASTWPRGTAAASSSSCRTPISRSSTASRRCCTVSVSRRTARRTRSRARSTFASSVLEWIGAGGKATEKRIPPMVFGWPTELLEAFLEGLVDGDGSIDDTRTSVWTTSEGLVADLLVLFARLGRRAGTCWRDRGHAPICQVYVPTREHKLLTCVPLPDELLVATRAHGHGSAHREPRGRIQARDGSQQHRAPTRPRRGADPDAAPAARRVRAPRPVPTSSPGSTGWSTAISCGTRWSRCATPGSPRRSSTSRCARRAAHRELPGRLRRRVRVEHRRIRRRGLGRAPHARAVERRQPADRAVPGDEDRPDLVPAHDHRRPSTRTAATPPARSTRASAARRRRATTSTSATPSDAARCPTDALRVGGHRPAHGRVPRRRVGRARRTTTAALFELLTLEGAQAGLSWTHDPAQARGLPRRVRRLRPGDTVAALHRRRRRAARSPTRRSCATAARSSRPINNARAVLAVQARARQLRRVRVGASSTARPIVGT